MDPSAPSLQLFVSALSGRGRALRLAPQAAALLRERGWEVEVVVTHREDDPGQLAAASTHQWVGVFGGDGYIAHIASEVGKRGGTVIPLPGGRGNDLCRCLGIGTDALAHIRKLPQASEIVSPQAGTSGRFRDVDAMRVAPLVPPREAQNLDAQGARSSEASQVLGLVSFGLDALANQFAISILSEGTHFQEKGFATKEQYRENIALRVKKREHPDCILVDFQDKPGGGKKSSIGVDQIREEVKGTADISPKEGEYKLYFLKHSDKMTVEAQNAILKTLEEAPDHVIILLFAQNETKLLPTVLSRVVKIFAGEMDTARHVQAFSEDPVLSRLLPFLKDLPYKKQGEMQDFADELGTVDSADLFCFLDIILRDVLCYKCTKSVDQLYEKEASPYLLEMAKRYSFSLLGKWSAYMERYRMGKTYNVQSPLQILDLFFLLHEEG